MAWTKHLKLALLGLFSFLLVACTDESATASKPDPLGDFKLGYAIVVAKSAQKGPLSRDATEEELIGALKPELERVLGVYEGDRFYHVAVNIDGYVLAVPGVPLVASPKSMLVVSVNVWDDAKGERITEEHKQFTIFEKISGKSLIGSGLTQSAEEQLAGLSKSAAKLIHNWLRENEQLFKADSTDTTDS